jgi:hypothetical protein
MEMPRLERGGPQHLRLCAGIRIDPLQHRSAGRHLGSRRLPVMEQTSDPRCSGCGARRVIPLTYIDTQGDRPHLHASDMRFRALWKCASCGLRSSAAPRYSTAE